MHTHRQPIVAHLRLEATGVPIYVQLRDQLRALIDAGVLKSGEQMPTMRQVAVALKVDLNTVRRAYDTLERSGAIALVRGRGSFVATRTAGGIDTITEPADRMARHVIGLARAAGIDPLFLSDRIVELSAEMSAEASTIKET